MTDDHGPETGTNRADDLRVARALREGDPAAVRGLFERLTPRLRSVAWNLSGGKLEAQDLIQEALIKLVSAPVLDGYRGEGPLDGYLLSVGVKQVISIARTERNRLRRTTSTDDVAKYAGAADPAATGLGSELREALGTLPERAQTIVLLIVVGDLSYAEVAASLDMEVNTVKSAYSRARTSLRAHLDPL